MLLSLSVFFKIKHSVLSLSNFLNCTDNQTSQAWIKKAATRTPTGKAFQRILRSLVINNPLGIKANFIPGVKNVLADAISPLTLIPHLLLRLKIYSKNSRRWHPGRDSTWVKNYSRFSSRCCWRVENPVYVIQRHWDTLQPPTTLHRVHQNNESW